MCVFDVVVCYTSLRSFLETCFFCDFSTDMTMFPENRGHFISSFQTCLSFLFLTLWKGLVNLAIQLISAGNHAIQDQHVALAQCGVTLWCDSGVLCVPLRVTFFSPGLVCRGWEDFPQGSCQGSLEGGGQGDSIIHLSTSIHDMWGLRSQMSGSEDQEAVRPGHFL